MTTEKRDVEEISVEIDGVTYKTGPATGTVAKKAMGYGEALDAMDLTDGKRARLQKKLEEDEFASEAEREAVEQKLLEVRKQMRAQNQVFTETMFKQAALVLVNDEGKNPKWEKLEEVLDQEEARLLVRKIFPRRIDEALDDPDADPNSDKAQ